MADASAATTATATATTAAAATTPLPPIVLMFRIVSHRFPLYVVWVTPAGRPYPEWRRACAGLDNAMAGTGDDQARQPFRQAAVPRVGRP